MVTRIGLNVGRDDDPLFLHPPMDDHHFGHKPKFFEEKHSTVVFLSSRQENITRTEISLEYS
jgi:hypothetical protein